MLYLGYFKGSKDHLDFLDSQKTSALHDLSPPSAFPYTPEVYHSLPDLGEDNGTLSSCIMCKLQFVAQFPQDQMMEELRQA